MIVDVNVYLSRWPCRRLPDDEPARLVAALQRNGIGQAWTGTFDALLHNDLTSANERLAAECRAHGPGLLLPFGCVNPKLPGWQEDLRRCAEVHQMRGIRLHPNYHEYTLDDPACLDLLRMAQERRLIVQLATSMEDDRTQHRLLRVPPVDVKPLLKIIQELPSLRVVLLNAQRSIPENQIVDLAAAGLVYCDIATLETVAGITKTLKAVPLERLLFGSYAPFFYLDAALLKFRESELANFQREAIQTRNAERLLK